MRGSIYFEDVPARQKADVAAVYTFLTEWRGKLYSCVGLAESASALLPGGPYYTEMEDGITEGVVALTVEKRLVGSGENEREVDTAVMRQVIVPAPPQQKYTITDLRFRSGGEDRRTFPTGFYAVMGRSGSGKSVFVRAWESALGYPAILVGEPVAGALPFSPVAHARAINEALSGDNPVALVDSLRMATLSGTALGPGGIPRDMGYQLSQLDYAAKLSNKMVLGVINLLTNDDRALDSAREILSGSCTGFFDVQGVDQSMSVTGTVAFRPDFRASSSFNLEAK